MLSVPKGKFAIARLSIGIVLLLCALTFYYFAVLKVNYYETGLLDLGWSDPSYYFAGAKAIMKDGYPYLNFGYQKLPSMYPPGYPALMLLWLKVLPEADSILAPFRTNQTIGLLLLLATFGFYNYLEMPLTGGFAALLMATLPVFFTFCRSSLSEVSASALIVLAFMFAYLGLKEERRWKIYLSTILLGLSLNVRVQSFFFAPLLLAMAVFPSKGTRLRWFLHCLGVIIAFILAASPTLLLNAVQFHWPFRTGYDFWLSGGDLPVRWAIFTAGHIPHNVVLLWKELTFQPKLFSAARYFGTGTSMVAAFVLLACLGLFFTRFNRFVICAFIAGLSFFVLTSSLPPEWVDVRYYLPLLILLVAVAVLPVTWAAENLFVARRALAALGIFILFAAACLGYPSRSLSNTTDAIGPDGRTEKIRSQAWEALHFPTPVRQSPWLTAERQFLQVFGRQPGIVLADINPLFLNALLPDPFLAAHLDGDRYAKSKLTRVVTYDRAQALALVKRGLSQSLPVYALFVSHKEMDEKSARLPRIDGYDWIVAENLPNKVVILKLNPR
jgi:hypothetical protein